MPAQYSDRRSAGQILAGHLRHYTDHPEAIVLGLPRGGVPVASEVARGLHIQLDVFIVRKLGVPGQEELALGAIASGGVRVLNQQVIESLRLTPDTIEAVADRELRELQRREELYRAGRPPLALRGRAVIIVDDGLATGSTMRAAVSAIRQHHAARIVVAVPVSAPDTCARLAAEVDELVCPLIPEGFAAVGHWYARFDQTTDDEVRRLLNDCETR